MEDKLTITPDVDGLGVSHTQESRALDRRINVRERVC